MKKVYFDNAATTPVHPKVCEKMKPFLLGEFGNPSSIHSFGRSVRVAIEEAREIVADFINADASEIYFTSGGTEANNFIINGIAKTEFSESKRNLLITNKAEHHAVLDTFEYLNENGYDSKIVNVNRNTELEIVELKNALSTSTSLVSCMQVNNETGTKNSIKELAQITKLNNSFFHTDAVQSFGKITIDVKELGVDALSGSAHKINGPKGTGFAFVKSGTPLTPLQFGGSQERNRRGGTENVAGIIGLGEAVKIKIEEMSYIYNHVLKLKTKMIEGIKNLDAQHIFINGNNSSLPFILNITLDSKIYNNDSEAMIMYLDINGVAASSGSACTSGTIKASHVIMASGYAPIDAAGTIRFSFGLDNNEDEVDFVLEVLKKMLKNFAKK